MFDVGDKRILLNKNSLIRKEFEGALVLQSYTTEVYYINEVCYNVLEIIKKGACFYDEILNKLRLTYDNVKETELKEIIFQLSREGILDLKDK